MHSTKYSSQPVLTTRYLRVPDLIELVQYKGEYLKKERALVWIKLHLDLLRDYNFLMLPEVAQAHVLKLRLLAASMDNILPDDPGWLGLQIGAKEPIDMGLLLAAGYIERVETVPGIARDDLRIEALATNSGSEPGSESGSATRAAPVPQKEIERAAPEQNAPANGEAAPHAAPETAARQADVATESGSNSGSKAGSKRGSRAATKSGSARGRKAGSPDATEIPTVKGKGEGNANEKGKARAHQPQRGAKTSRRAAPPVPTSFQSSPASPLPSPPSASPQSEPQAAATRSGGAAQAALPESDRVARALQMLLPQIRDGTYDPAKLDTPIGRRAFNSLSDAEFEILRRRVREAVAGQGREQGRER